MKIVIFFLISLLITNCVPEIKSVNTTEQVKPSQNLKQLSLDSIFYQDLYKRSAKSRVKLAQITKAIARKYQFAEAIIPDLKSFESTKSKVDGKYKGNWKKVTDIVRGSISFHSLKDIYSGIQDFNKSDLHLIYIKDRFSNPTINGYRDIYGLFYDRDNDIIGEIQFHLCHILEVKEQGHQIYEIIRQIERMASTNLRELTCRERLKINNLRQDSKRIYNKAYDAAIKGYSCKPL